MLSSRREAFDLDAREIESGRSMPVGTYAETVDGRGYRYALAGGSNLDPGKLCVAATVDSNATNRAVTTAQSVGSVEVPFTAAGSITANKYADGFLTVNDAAGEGISYRVKGHNGGTAVVAQLEEPLKVALTTSSEVTLTQNPYSAVVVSVTDQADLPVGVPNVAITAAYYGWVQTKGLCSVLADEAVTAGLALTTGTGVAGAVEALDGLGEPQIGIALAALVDTEYREALLTID